MHFLDQLTDEELRQRLSAANAAKCLKRLRQQIIECHPDPPEPSQSILRLEDSDDLIDHIVIALTCGGSILMEGNPGLGKSLVAGMTGTMCGLVYKRIQFVPDLMPTDLLVRETLIWDELNNVRPKTVLGPVFTNLLLADEINRASPKTQAALLEAMQERQVSLLHHGTLMIRPVEPLDEKTLLSQLHEPYFGLPILNPDTHDGQTFTVLATQNPIEQEGVYPVAQAALDRFMFKFLLGYPTREALDRISEYSFKSALGQQSRWKATEAEHGRTLYFFAAAQQLVLGPEAKEHWDSPECRSLREKIVTLIDFTHIRRTTSGRADESLERVDATAEAKQRDIHRTLSGWKSTHPARQPELMRLLHSSDPDRPFPAVLSGSSPRGLKIIGAAFAHALLKGHVDGDRVLPTWSDVKAVAPAVLRHRIRIDQTEEAQGHTSDSVIERLMEWIDTWE